MNRTSLGIIAIAGVVLILALQWHAPAQDSTTGNTDSVRRFGTKIVMVQVSDGTTQTSNCIKDATLEKIGDRYFVRGKGYVSKKYLEDDRYNWYDGVDVSYAWSSVFGCYELTEEQMEKYDKAQSQE